ncbi:exported hypothetical protein [Vibrio harveyi]|nr:exported hypothetical protein [Vibrio harveyi]
MFIRFALVILTMNILNPVHAIQFSYDDMGRSASSQFNNSANDKTVFYVHDNSSNVISVSNNIDLYLFFEPVQNYSDTVITFGVENYKSDFIYDLYIYQKTCHLYYTRALSIQVLCL